MFRAILISGTAFVLAGCTAYADGYAYRTPLIAIDRGDRVAFCQNYADQTAANTFYNNADEDSGGGLIAYRQAGAVGDRAYRRCLEGRTG